ncbi:unnamed protein product [Ixodes hexagonus]
MSEAAGGGSSSSSSNGSRRTPVIRLHGAPTLSPRLAPKKGGRRASEFYFREPEYLAPPRATVSTPPPGRKRSASLPHVRSPSPVPPPLARAARAHHVTQHGRAKEQDDEEEDEEEEERKADREEDEEGAEDAENQPQQQQQHEQQPQHRSRLLGATAASADRRKSSPCQPRFPPVRRGRPSLDLSAGHGVGQITLGSHLDSEIARRRHSVAASVTDKTATSTHDSSQRFGASDKVNAHPEHESWLEEASSSDDDFTADAKPTMSKPNASTGVPAATGNGSRRPVS